MCMIALDTNVLVRAIVRDDAKQAAAAQKRLLALTTRDPGFVTHIVLVELWWVLTRSYKYNPARALVPVDQLCHTAGIVVQDVDLVMEAIAAVRDKGADFADALIVATAKSAGCVSVETFDKAAISRAGMCALAGS